MHILDVFYNKYYFPTLINRKNSKKRNKKNRFTLLCANCMGGYMYHQLGVKFQSPTINLMMLQPDFYTLISNLEKYLKEDFVDISEKSGIPRGKLGGEITVHFTHYRDFQEAVQKWNERASRVDLEELYIITSDRDGVTSEQINNLQNVHCKKLLCFTAKKYDLPYCFQVKEFETEKEIGNILKKTISGKWYFEEVFDWVGWLNSEDNIAEHFRIYR